MNQEDFLGRLVAKLEDAGIPYIISGSLGSSLHGEPRATSVHRNPKQSAIGENP